MKLECKICGKSGFEIILYDTTIKGVYTVLCTECAKKLAKELSK